MSREYSHSFWLYHQAQKSHYGLEWQAILSQMEEMGRRSYVIKLKQSGEGSTYWQITPKGETYLQAHYLW
jgi:hypothetical protein